MKSKSEWMLEKLQKKIPLFTELRFSIKGVPHLLLNGGDNIIYSICYFKKSRLFKIFYPYPAKKQTKVICKEWINVLEFFKFRNNKNKNLMII